MQRTSAPAWRPELSVIIKGKNPRKPHTVRYWIAGRQRERSFTTAREARDFMTKIEYEARTQSFTDPALGAVRFTDYANDVISNRAIAPGTRKVYRIVLSKWVAPWAGDRTLRQVADDREGVAKLLNVTMAAKVGRSRRSTANAMLSIVVSEAVKAGRINSHRLDGIGLIDVPVDDDEELASFVFPSYSQTRALAEQLAPYGIVIWLMRGCGLRISEALAIRKEDFISEGTVLRCQRQASPDGNSSVRNLKHRKPGDYRDIPAPGYLWQMVSDLPAGYLCPAVSYSIVYKAFVKARDAVGISPGFTPHSLRHVFASALLAEGVPVTDVATWLGHKDINVTYATYGHLIPSAAGKARAVLDSEFHAWREKPNHREHLPSD
jgi:integrase